MKCDLKEQVTIVQDIRDSRSERVPWLHDVTKFPYHVTTLKDEEIWGSYRLPPKKELDAGSEDTRGDVGHDRADAKQRVDERGDRGAGAAVDRAQRDDRDHRPLREPEQRGRPERRHRDRPEAELATLHGRSGQRRPLSSAETICYMATKSSAEASPATGPAPGPPGDTPERRCHRRPWSATAVRAKLRHLAVQAGSGAGSRPTNSAMRTPSSCCTRGFRCR